MEIKIFRATISIFEPNSGPSENADYGVGEGWYCLWRTVRDFVSCLMSYKVS